MSGSQISALLGAHNINRAQIILHEPFARPGSYACISAYKILSSSRAIVELLHQVSSTSYDVSSLDLYPFVSNSFINVVRLGLTNRF